MTIYTDTATGFDHSETATASILVGHAEAHLARALAHEHATQLQDALRSNRAIGVAIGLVMAAHDLSEEQGFFKMLRAISQNTNRKLALVADDITHDRRTSRP